MFRAIWSKNYTIYLYLMKNKMLPVLPLVLWSNNFISDKIILPDINNYIEGFSVFSILLNDLLWNVNIL